MKIKPCSGEHKFEARYDILPPYIEGYSEFYAAEILKAGTQKKYVKDVCVQCGVSVKRSNA